MGKHLPGKPVFFTKDNRLWKNCPTCDRALPFNSVYFGKNPRQGTGLNYNCKKCEAKRFNKYQDDLKKGYKPPEEKRNCQRRQKEKKELRSRLKEEMKDLVQNVKKKKKKKEIGEDDLFYGLL